MKKSVILFGFLFFVGWLFSISDAAEHQQKGHAGKSAPQGSPGKVQGNLGQAGRQMHPGQGGVQRGDSRNRGGQQMHSGDRGRPGDRRGFEGRGLAGPHSGHFDFRGHGHYDRLTVQHRVIWRGGGWRNGCYGGHCGSWWVAGGYWHFYPERVYGYAYPSVISAIVFDAALIEAAILAPIVVAPVISVPIAVARPQVAIVQPQAQYWYYCPTSGKYAPYVETCNVEWEKVPIPPQAPPPPK